MVLGGDLDAAGAQVHHRMVAAAMPELQLAHAGARRLAYHLMAQAYAEHRQLSQQTLHLTIGAIHRFRVAGAIA